jgi:type I restriction enzyme S subunit
MRAGWVRKKLGDVATLQRGYDLPTHDRVAGKFPLVSSSGISDTHHEYAVRGPGVVTGRSGSIGNVFFIEEDFWPLNTTLYVKDFHGNNPRFVFHLLRNFDLQRFASGAGVPTLNRNFVHDELVGVPPLPEQQRIVGILDDAFAGIATAKANAEKNLQNARALFEGHLQAVFSQREDTWVEKRLSEIADFKNGLNFSQNSNGQSVRFVGVGDFQSNSIVPIDELSSVTIDGDLNGNYAIQKDDILTVRSNGSKYLVGRCMIVPDIRGVVSYSGFIIRIRCVTKTINPKFLLHFMKCSSTREQLTNEGGGANISNINQAKLSALSVPLPSLSTQQLQCEKLDRLQLEIQRLSSIYQRKLAALESLKKSLLHQAFTGAL